MFTSVPSQTPAPLDNIAVILIVILLLAFAVLRLGRRKSNRWARSRFRPKSVPSLDHTDLHHPTAQMEAIAKAGFSTRRLLNKEEYRLLLLIEDVLRNDRMGHRLIIQASLGELLTTTGPDKQTRQRAFASINSKRLDFGIVDRGGMLRLAIEYQGSGHYHQRSFMRDAVKREALRKAGVHLLEVGVRHDNEQVKRDIRSCLVSPQASRPNRAGTVIPWPTA